MPRFLISRLSALGDVVCTVPAAVALKRSFPEAEIVWAVDPRFAGIVECSRSVDRVVRVKPGVSPKSWRVEGGPFDAAFDLQGLLKSALVVAASGAPMRLGYHWQREGAWLLSRRVWPDPSSHHVVDQYVDVVRAFGATADRAEWDLEPHAEDLAQVRAKLHERGVSGSFALLNAGAGWASKRWPPSRFAEVVHGLAAQGMPAVFLGGPGTADREAFHAIVADAPMAVDMVGQTNVRELVALVSLASVHVGGDTGSTHLAAALGVPAVGLYSITRPERVCPYGQRERTLYGPDGLSSIASEDVLRLVLAEL